jgi:hypothetical protein
MSKRSEDYNLKLIPARVAEDFTAKATRMQQTFSSLADEMITLEESVRTILAGVTPATPVLLQSGYQALAKEMWGHIYRGSTGTMTQQWCDILTQKYIAYGLLDSTIAAIMLACFTLTATPNP